MTLKSAERRPARTDFPPRRIRAATPDHSNVACIDAFRCENELAIKDQTPKQTQTARRIIIRDCGENDGGDVIRCFEQDMKLAHEFKLSTHLGKLI